MGLTYKELIQLSTFEDRFEYLRIGANIGEETFGFNRYLNQSFYHSPEWKRFRREIILRDDGCDLAIKDRPIKGRVILHHLNPISESDIFDHTDVLFDPNNVICVSHDTHNALHYGDISLLAPSSVNERLPGDTKLW